MFYRNKLEKPVKWGRPTKYTPEMIEKAFEYLQECTDDIDEFHKTRGEKSDSYERIIHVNIPTVEGLALFLKVSKQTLYDWAKKRQGFLDVMEMLNNLQSDALIRNGLSGDYNPALAKLILSKHGYREESGVGGLNGEQINGGVVFLPKKMYEPGSKSEQLEATA